MMNLKKQRRIQVVTIAGVCLVAATALIGFAFKDGINFFRSPTQVVEAPPLSNEVFRIGGLVEADSLKMAAEGSVTFNVTDGNASVPVVYAGILPDLFKEGEGMVGTGQFLNGTFKATEILAKHDETYMPAEVIDALKEQGVYQPADGENSTLKPISSGASDDT